MNQTAVTKPLEIVRAWHLIDLKGKTLGRVSTQIAILLIGKNKPLYSPSVDCGDYVVVINSKDIKVTGNKAEDKLYRHHTGHPGGFREYNYNHVASNNPNEIILHSVKGMLPQNKLRDRRLTRLKIYADSKHPYQDKFIQGK